MTSSIFACTRPQVQPRRAGCASPLKNSTEKTRRTYLAQAWREPRSFTERYGALLTGLSAQERRARLARVAKAITHPAIPEEERHHLHVNTMATYKG